MPLQKQRGNNVSKKTIAGIIAGAIVSIEAFLSWIFGRNTNGRGIQRSTDNIESGAKRTDRSKERNKDAQEYNRKSEKHINAAGRNIDSAIRDVADAQNILDQASKRSKQ